MDKLIELGYTPAVKTKGGVIIGFNRPGENGYIESIHFNIDGKVKFYKLKSQGWEVTDMNFDTDEIFACEAYARELGIPEYAKA